MNIERAFPGRRPAGPRRNQGLLSRVGALTLAATVTLELVAGYAAAADAPGTTYTYRLINGYNNEVQGQVVYRVDSINAERISFSVTPDTPSAGLTRSEIYTREGNWIRHPIVNHDQLTNYEFPTPYPAYAFPLETGKSWSVRIDAINPANGRRNSVRIDGEVLGTERVRVPAGEFDAIKVRRNVYAGDVDMPKEETRITEIDWYVPSLGRPVKTQSGSSYVDATFGPRNRLQRGDRPIYELVSTSQQP